MDLVHYKVETVPIDSKFLNKPSALTVYYDSIIYATTGDSLIHSVAKSDGSNHTVLRNGTEGVFGLKVYDKDLQNRKLWFLLKFYLNCMFIVLLYFLKLCL